MIINFTIAVTWYIKIQIKKNYEKPYNQNVLSYNVNDWYFVKISRRAVFRRVKILRTKT